MDDDRLYDEVVDQMELWARRADYWRGLACAFAGGQLEPYPIPFGGDAHLRDAVRRSRPAMEWSNGQLPPMTVKRRWWFAG